MCLHVESRSGGHGPPERMSLSFSRRFWELAAGFTASRFEPGNSFYSLGAVSPYLSEMLLQNQAPGTVIYTFMVPQCHAQAPVTISIGRLLDPIFLSHQALSYDHDQRCRDLSKALWELRLVSHRYCHPAAGAKLITWRRRAKKWVAMEP